jgi:hypothetical protein
MTYEEYIKRQNSKSRSREMANKEDSSSGANSAAAIIDESGFVDEDLENDELKTPAVALGEKVSVGRADRVNATMAVDYGHLVRMSEWKTCERRENRIHNSIRGSYYASDFRNWQRSVVEYR